MKTPLTGSPSNVLNILTAWTLMGGGYIVREKNSVIRDPATPSSAVLAGIHFVFLLFCSTWIMFCLPAHTRPHRQPEIWKGNRTQEQIAFVHKCIRNNRGSVSREVTQISLLKISIYSEFKMVRNCQNTKKDGKLVKPKGHSHSIIKLTDSKTIYF